MLCAGNTRRRASVPGGIKRAGHLEHREVQDAVRTACACKGVADNVATRKELACPVIIVEQNQVKRAAATQSYYRIQLPAVTNQRMALPEVRHVIGDSRHEAVARIKI